ncbi:hypothetical protein QAD02_003537 [Eretmocerus hayati]|uniref:Uncharacterized protein n=1 Tax=Eretmocerus hayati TaxID=131215 RepID=A0ACC2NM40_9HYME|nr:hypothetical protein QAD02_003537 [Eretmocerus hayati]
MGKRDNLDVGQLNVVHEHLVSPAKVLLPPLHIKLELIKQFVKALDKEGRCFQYLPQKFSHIREATLKEGIFGGPQIRKLFGDQNFGKTMLKKEKNAWVAFKKVVQGFLGNETDENYKFLGSILMGILPESAVSD